MRLVAGAGQEPGRPVPAGCRRGVRWRRGQASPRRHNAVKPGIQCGRSDAVKVLIHCVPAGAAARAPARGISRPKITGILVQRAESRSSNSPGRLRLPRGRAFLAFPGPICVTFARGRGGCVPSGKGRQSRSYIRITPVYIAGNTPPAIAGVPGPGPGRRQPGTYAPRCIPAGSSA